jgi:ribosomal protein S18 acetylase RimI-like enzyme
MKAPKLLMIYLLRTTAAAFATSRARPSSTVRAFVPDTSTEDRPLLSDGHITYRLARATDIPQIQSCNLATLPENYNDNFYRNHMRQWPELALVAEHVPRDFDGNDDGREGEDITPLKDYLYRVRKGADASRPRKEIVGYILGKVEDRPVLYPPVKRPPSKVVPLYDGPFNGQPPHWDKPPSTEWEKMGHVTSIAVHSHARRLGIASSLLHQLHYHLSECYSAQAVGLHVRISNAAAVKLYVETLGYDVADIIPMYYGDGEDAYFMKRELVEQPDLRAYKGHQQSQRHGQQQVPDWVNRDTRSSFFDNRSSMRDTLTPEERAWVNTNNGSRTADPQGLSGKVSRSFRTFLNGSEQMQRRFSAHHNNFRSFDNWQQRPPWETGPEGLRLPRYSKIVRRVVDADEAKHRGQNSGVLRREEKEDVAVGEFEEVHSVAASGTG